ncbi:MAG TPA: aminomethyl-transferring glycine dehydrogenase subunit GcvPA [Actinomycetota bacterium]|nr:aminomethyl-transferring glycine dehydrogenase subunit GcvPA [Actinomycetota bacterium]
MSAGDFVPHTEADVRSMLDVIGASSIDDLFSVVPPELRDPNFELVPALSEPEVVAHLSSLAERNDPAGGGLSFLGGGLYDHYVPAAVRAIASRGEFATAYTPYQAEASQGTLQYLFEFQTMVAELFGLSAANASLYDAATGLVEAVNLAAARNPARRVLLAPGVNPRYGRVLDTYSGGLGILVETLPENDFGTEPGAIAEAARDEHVLAVVVQQPNVHGFLEEAEDLAAAASEAGAVTIAVCDPVSLGVIAPPGEWGASIALAEGQAVGNPIAFGGQCVGLFACDEQFVRQMPGRLVGETADADGQRGYVLTLQAREQHIKREKAGSNICTNQSLFALMVTVHLSWLGPQGLARVADLSASIAHDAAARIEGETAFRLASSRPFLREFALRGPKPAAEVLSELADRGIWAGPSSESHPDVFTLAFTERRTPGHVDALVEALSEVGKP